MQVKDLTRNEPDQCKQTANLLLIAFETSWPNFASAMEEVEECLVEENINRIVVSDEGEVLGWIGGEPNYDGAVWEIHPLVVHPEHQRQGIGTLLLREFEMLVAQRGGLTLYLGTDDELGQTTVGGIDVYPNALEKLSNLKNLDGHPFEFYQKAGFELVGLIPDANGFGKPDIMMAKRVHI